jgi:plasmid replication initiation protein
MGFEQNSQKIVNLKKVNIMAIKIQRGADKESLKIALSKIKEGKKLDTSKYCGVVKISQDPLQIQKEMRDEWR